MNGRNGISVCTMEDPDIHLRCENNAVMFIMHTDQTEVLKRLKESNERHGIIFLYDEENIIKRYFHKLELVTVF